MTSLDHTKILSLVEAALADATALDDVHQRVALQLDQRDKLPQSFQDLLAYIDADAGLEIFRGGIYQLGRGSGSVQRDLLVRFLIRGAITSSPRSAIDQLERYLAAETVPCARRTIVCGVNAREPFWLDKNTRFVPWGQITADGDDTVQQEGDRMRSATVTCHPSGLIEALFELPKQHVSSGAVIKPQEPPSALFDARGPVMALQLVCPSAVFGPVTWHHFPEWCIPAQRGGRYFQPFPEQTGLHELTDVEISEARILLQRINAMGPSDVERLWLMTH